MRSLGQGFLVLLVIAMIGFAARVAVLSNINRLDRADARVWAILQSIDLPQVGCRGLEAPAIAVRMWITQTSIGMDNARTVRVRTPRDHARLAQTLGAGWNDAPPLVEPALAFLPNEDIAQLGHRDGWLGTLAARVSAFAEVESALCGANEISPSNIVHLYVDRATPLNVLINVWNTLRRTGLVPKLVVQTPNGLALLPMDEQPRACSRASTSAVEQADGAFPLTVFGCSSWCWDETAAR